MAKTTTRRSFRPVLEALEARCCPAPVPSLVWAPPAGSADLWETPGNWKTPAGQVSGSFPSGQTSVKIPARTPSVQVEGSDSCGSLTMDAGANPVIMDNGTSLTVGGNGENSTISGGGVSVGVQDATASLNITGSMIVNSDMNKNLWDSQLNTSIINGGSLTIGLAGSGSVTIGGNLLVGCNVGSNDSQGTLTFNGGSVSVTNPAALTYPIATSKQGVINVTNQTQLTVAGPVIVSGTMNVDATAGGGRSGPSVNTGTGATVIQDGGSLNITGGAGGGENGGGGTATFNNLLVEANSYLCFESTVGPDGSFTQAVLNVTGTLKLTGASITVQANPNLAGDMSLIQAETLQIDADAPSAMYVDSTAASDGQTSYGEPVLTWGTLNVDNQAQWNGDVMGWVEGTGPNADPFNGAFWDVTQESNSLALSTPP